MFPFFWGNYAVFVYGTTVLDEADAELTVDFQLEPTVAKRLLVFLKRSEGGSMAPFSYF